MAHPQILLTRQVDLIQATDTSHATFTYTTAAGRHLVTCIQSRNDSITKDQVEQWNNTIDYEALRSLTIVTFGGMTDEARTAYLRLRSCKPLHVVQGDDLSKAVSNVLPHAQLVALSDHDPTKETVDIIVVGLSFLVLVRGRGDADWFIIISEDGQFVDGSSEVVRGIRVTYLDLETAKYGARDALRPRHKLDDSVDAFDRTAYLARCYTEFNSIKYTALAAMGVRLPDLPLEALYIDANAEAGTDSGRNAALARSIQACLDSMGLQGALRHELEVQLTRSYGVGNVSETSAARRFYQQFGAVCVEGDPGSGKTCFVKSEILAYCRPPQSEPGWYLKHTPVYIPLAEAWRRLESEKDLLRVAAEILSVRGMPLQEPTLRKLFHAGQLAFFFDGLDEVVLVEQRARIAASIKQLVDGGLAVGNRFVLTTRPAAALVVELPTELRVIHLCGFSPDEQRALARRVLAARVSQSSEGATLESGPLSERDESIAAEVIDDVRQSVGLGRLATNPLFLTLLVFIYANSGRPAARKHKVYAEAVRTLAMVRSRIANQRVLSDIDLRRRLGAVALFMFEGADTTIASRAHVASALVGILSAELGAAVEPSEADTFIQDVAEATGLLVLNEGGPDQEATITFMHQSFLEYFAAMGLSTRDYISDVRRLSQQPRWREVIQLLCGIVGDHNDVAPLLRALLKPSAAEGITSEALLFAYECALECEVPPDGVIRLLLEQTALAAQNGPLRADSELRARVGENLARLSSATTSPLIVRFLANGLESTAETDCAFFVEMLGCVAREVQVTEVLLDPFRRACKRRESTVLAAVCDAAAGSRDLRVPEAIDAIRRALDAGVSARMAAARSAAAAEGISTAVWTDLVKAMRDANPVVAAAAADSVMQAGLDLKPGALDADTTHVLVQALQRVDDEFHGDSDPQTVVALDRASVDERLSSTNPDTRVLAIRTLPWLRNEEAFIIERLRGIIKSESASSGEKVAALAVLGRARAPRRLLKVADVDRIRALLSASTKDVRQAACRVLGTVAVGSASLEGIVDDVLSYASRSQKGEEFRCAVRSLGRVAPRAERVARYLARKANEFLVRPNSRDEADVLALLRAVQTVDGGAHDELPAKLRATARGSSAAGGRSLKAHARIHQPAVEIRRECVVALAHVEVIGPSLLQFLTALVRVPIPGLGNAAARGLSAVVERCRRRVADVRRAFADLQVAAETLLSHYAKYRGAVIADMSEGAVAEIRVALEEINGLLIAYREFAERSSLGLIEPAPVGA